MHAWLVLCSCAGSDFAAVPSIILSLQPSSIRYTSHVPVMPLYIRTYRPSRSIADESLLEDNIIFRKQLVTYIAIHHRLLEFTTSWIGIQ